MASVTRNDLNAGVLQTWLSQEIIENLRHKLFFHQLGEKPMIQDDYGTVAWAKFTRLAYSNTTKGTTSNDGTTPSDTAFNATVVSCSPFQIRIVVNFSDMVLRRNKIDFLRGAAVEVASAIAEKVDYEIQAVVMAGTRYLYASGDHSTRATLDSTDTLTFVYIQNAVSWLRAQGAPTYEDGSYICVLHPWTTEDLMQDSTSTSNWLETAKYTRPDLLYNGEIGKYAGVRFVESGFVQTLTTNIYPALVLGKGAYGVADFDTLEAYVTPDVSSDSDPLKQRRKVGAKLAFNAIILDNDRMMRVECYSGAVTPAST